MYVAYRRRPRYVCTSLRRAFAEPRCAHLDGPSIEAFVVQAFFDAIAPAQLATLDEVLAQRQRERQRLETYQQQQVSHARFAATLARRRYEQVDPAYRLVAAELEREWDDDALRAMATDPDDLDFNPIRGHPLDHHACHQAAQPRLTLRVTELRARPQIGEALTQVQQLIAGLWR